LEVNILYVTRSDKFWRPKADPYTKIKRNIKLIGLKIKRHLVFSAIDGFFEASLGQAGNVTRVSNSNLSKQSFVGQDALVVNFRCVDGKRTGDYARLIEIGRNFSGAKALFVDTDEARFIPDDEVLNGYDFIFKREPYLDLDRYPISSSNKFKIRPTMLSCPYFTHSPYKLLDRKKHENLLTEEIPEKEFDIFFIGKASEERIEAWTKLKKRPDLKISGGLLPRKAMSHLDPSLLTIPISKEDFISNLRKSRINLAIDGHGEFTFRHLEIWCAGGFLLAHANLRDIWLPLSMREHEHFECYNDIDDLLEKIDYFIQHPEEANRIGASGSKVFQREYSVKHHGSYIQKHLTS
jgi:hypothetical protein